MKTKWRADITNNPNDDFNLCVEIFFDDEHVGTIKRNEQNIVEMTLHSSQREFRVPAQWLTEVLAKAMQDLP